MEVEILNREHHPNPQLTGLLTDINLKTENPGLQVVDVLFVNGEEVPKENYSATYTATDAIIAIRNLPVTSEDQELIFDANWKAPEAVKEEIPPEVETQPATEPPTAA